MDTRLFEASQTGDVQLLHQLLAEIPLLLHSVALVSAENPLHLASIAGHAEFVKDMLRLRPDFAKELNHGGFSPMHVASANGYLEIVRELLKVGPGLCQLKGREEWTPLHYAACRGRVDVIREMILACPESVEDVTLQGETCFHLAVKNSQFEAIKVLMELIIESRKVNVLNLKDKLGNSVLHLATWKKQHQVVEWLVGINGLEVNSVNQSGLTALDLLVIFPSEAGDREIDATLCGAGALRAQQTSHSHNHSLLNNTMASETHPLQHPEDLIEYFKFKKGRDSPSDACTPLLVIAVLVATATFQVGLSPPNGLWQDSIDLSNNTTSNNSTEPVHYAGTSIMGSWSAVTFVLFVAFNSIGFSISLYMICVLTSKFPLQLELQICVIAMFCTYNFAVNCIAPANTKVYITVLTSVFPSLVPAAANFARRHIWRFRAPVNWIHRLIWIRDQFM